VNTVKELCQVGLSTYNIAKKLKLQLKDVKKEIKINNYKLEKVDFSFNLEQDVQDLHILGVSHKNISQRFKISRDKVDKISYNLVPNNYDEDYILNYNIFDKLDSDAKNYWLGFIFGICKNDINTLNFIVDEKSLLEKFCNFINLDLKYISQTELLNSKKQIYYRYMLEIKNKHVCETLQKLGLSTNKYKTIYPTFNHESQNRNFIRGLFDARGHLTMSSSNNEWKLRLPNNQLICNEVQLQIKNHTCRDVRPANFQEVPKSVILEATGNEQVAAICDWLYDNSTDNIRSDYLYNKFNELKSQQNNRSFLKSRI